MLSQFRSAPFFSRRPFSRQRLLDFMLQFLPPGPAPAPWCCFCCAAPARWCYSCCAAWSRLSCFCRITPTPRRCSQLQRLITRLSVRTTGQLQAHKSRAPGERKGMRNPEIKAFRRGRHIKTNWEVATQPVTQALQLLPGILVLSSLALLKVMLGPGPGPASWLIFI
jgi:hypothetical protein